MGHVEPSVCVLGGCIYAVYSYVRSVLVMAPEIIPYSSIALLNCKYLDHWFEITTHLTNQDYNVKRTLTYKSLVFSYVPGQ